METIEEELREQFFEAFSPATYPISNQMDLVPTLPKGMSTRFESGDFSMTVIELSMRLTDKQNFPYEAVEDLIEDLINGMKEKGLI
tara:strand:- start:226 stop:483 length:258 start_codon:yes stop_codon:yes gene_type:complete